MDYRDTLNLPRTDFPMKANLPERETEMLNLWHRLNIYELIRQMHSNEEKFVLHDGPPYANGDIHIGHAFNKVLKDMVVKYKTLRGFDAPFVPGWDCHGLPVEHQLFKELRINRDEIDRLSFRKKAAEFASRFVQIQKEQFIRLGVFADWQRPYLTLDPKYESSILSSFAKLVKRGSIYKGLRPVNWCSNCETALAEAEVEYQQRLSPSIYVKFKLDPGSWILDPGKKILSTIEHQESSIPEVSFLIWTTTPWTLVSNVAIALQPELRYALLRFKSRDNSEEILIIAEDLVETTLDKLEDIDYKIVNTIAGRELEGLSCRHPFIDRHSKVVLADFVSKQEGTGCVHIAPGHGAEDYQLGLELALKIVMPVDGKGKFESSFGVPADLIGVNVLEANGMIIEKLKQSNALFYHEQISHSYPHCWRCKGPIIFRATEQWFMNIDRQNLRQRLLEVIEKEVNWIPEIGRFRISSMVSERPDWCLSRQRYWGVPIPAFYCANCGEAILDAKFIEGLSEKVRRFGSDIWFEKESEEVFSGIICPKCQGRKFVKEKDIIDVWFDSGVSHQAVLKAREDLKFPAELYLEGSDQHRGWFQSALITCLGIGEDSPPFRTVLTHGFVVDGEGRKMSKSVGNVVSPLDVIRDLGADILRLWAASCNYQEDVRISDRILGGLKDSYRKMRNTFRFMLANLYDFDPVNDLIEYQKLQEVDRWALSKTSSLLKDSSALYDSYRFYQVYQKIYLFCNCELSNFYLDILKDRLYTFGARSTSRKSAQTALYQILLCLAKAVSPILSFTAEETWQHIRKVTETSESIFLSRWPDLGVLESWQDAELEEKWTSLIQVRELCLKELENLRKDKLIGNSLEAEVTIYCQEPTYSLLRNYETELTSIFLVCSVELLKWNGQPKEVAEKFDPGVKAAISCKRTQKKKCQRCWNRDSTVGTDPRYPSVCARCTKVLEEIGSFEG